MNTIKTYLIGIIILFSMVGVTAYTYIQRTQKQPIVFGAYDSTASFDTTKTSILHRFEAWDKITPDSLQSDLERLSQNNNTPMITIEPWNQGEDKDTLLESIAGGKYDGIIAMICQGIERFDGQKVIARWGHEVDLHGRSRYPWAQDKPQEYIAAFQHWVTQCKRETRKVKYMWSPAGVEGLERFYPGNKYVDVVGLSIFGYPEYEQELFGRLFNFNDVFNSRYERVAIYNKPVYIAEFGIAGTDEYKQTWLKHARNQILNTDSFPLLRAVVYFNGQDPNPWVPNINPPDFRIDPQWLLEEK